MSDISDERVAELRAAAHAKKEAANTLFNQGDYLMASRGYLEAANVLWPGAVRFEGVASTLEGDRLNANFPSCPQHKDIRSDLATLYSNRCQCYLKLGDWDLAIRDADCAVLLSGPNVKILWRRCQAYEKKGEVALARKDVVAAIRLSDDDPSSGVHKLMIDMARQLTETLRRDSNAASSIDHLQAILLGICGKRVKYSRMEACREALSMVHQSSDNLQRLASIDGFIASLCEVVVTDTDVLVAGENKNVEEAIANGTKVVAMPDSDTARLEAMESRVVAIKILLQLADNDKARRAVAIDLDIPRVVGMVASLKEALVLSEPVTWTAARQSDKQGAKVVDLSTQLHDLEEQLACVALICLQAIMQKGGHNRFAAVDAARRAGFIDVSMVWLASPGLRDDWRSLDDLAAWDAWDEEEFEMFGVGDTSLEAEKPEREDVDMRLSKHPTPFGMSRRPGQLRRALLSCLVAILVDAVSGTMLIQKHGQCPASGPDMLLRGTRGTHVTALWRLASSFDGGVRARVKVILARLVECHGGNGREQLTEELGGAADWIKKELQIVHDYYLNSGHDLTPRQAWECAAATALLVEGCKGCGTFVYTESRLMDLYCDMIKLKPKLIHRDDKQVMSESERMRVQQCGAEVMAILMGNRKGLETITNLDVLTHLMALVTLTDNSGDLVSKGVKREEISRLRLSVALALARITLFDDLTRQVVVTDGGLPLILELAASGRRIQQRVAAEALAYLAYNDDVRDAMMKGLQKGGVKGSQEGVDVMNALRLLSVVRDTQVQLGVAQAVNNATKPVEALKEDEEMTRQKIMVNLMQQRQQAVDKNEVNAIMEKRRLFEREYEQNTDKFRIQFVANGGTQILTPMAKSPSLAVRQLVLEALYTLTFAKVNRGKFIQDGGLRSLVELTRSGDDLEIQLSKIGRSGPRTQADKERHGDLIDKAAHGIAKCLMSVNPALLPGSLAMDCVRPVLLTAGSFHELAMFEGALAIGNLAVTSDELRATLVRFKAWQRMESLVFEDHIYVQRAAVQALLNLLATEQVWAAICGVGPDGWDTPITDDGSKLLLWDSERMLRPFRMACQLDDAHAKAAAAMAYANLCDDPRAARAVRLSAGCVKNIVDLMQCGNEDIQWPAVNAAFNMAVTEEGCGALADEEAVLPLLLMASKDQSPTVSDRTREMAQQTLIRINHYRGTPTHIPREVLQPCGPRLERDHE